MEAVASKEVMVTWWRSLLRGAGFREVMVAWLPFPRVDVVCKVLMDAWWQSLQVGVVFREAMAVWLPFHRVGTVYKVLMVAWLPSAPVVMVFREAMAAWFAFQMESMECRMSRAECVLNNTRTMKPLLNDYLIPIGRLAIAAAFLEEVVIRWGALLSEAAPHETHAKRLRRGLENNLKFLKRVVEQQVSPARQKAVTIASPT